MREALTDGMARLPWPLALVLAGLSLVLLHLIARQGIAAANVAQYIVPLLFVGVALVSVSRQRQKRQWQQQVSELSGTAVIDGMGWPEFELLVREGFRRRGYAVGDTGTSTADRVGHLVISRGREQFLVLCRQWRAMKVDLAAVRELHTAITAQGAAGGFVVTAGVFTPDAARFADGRGIRLIDGLKLHDLVHSADEKTIPLIRRRTEPVAPLDSMVSRD